MPSSSGGRRAYRSRRSRAAPMPAASAGLPHPASSWRCHVTPSAESRKTPPASAVTASATKRPPVQTTSTVVEAADRRLVGDRVPAVGKPGCRDRRGRRDDRHRRRARGRAPECRDRRGRRDDRHRRRARGRAPARRDDDPEEEGRGTALRVHLSSSRVRVRAADETFDTGRCCGRGGSIGDEAAGRAALPARTAPLEAHCELTSRHRQRLRDGDPVRRARSQRSAGVHARGSAAFALPRDSARDDVRSPGPWLPGPP